MEKENSIPVEMLPYEDAPKIEKLRRTNMLRSAEKGRVNTDEVDDDERVRRALMYYQV